MAIEKMNQVGAIDLPTLRYGGQGRDRLVRKTPNAQRRTSNAGRRCQDESGRGD